MTETTKQEYIHRPDPEIKKTWDKWFPKLAFAVAVALYCVYIQVRIRNFGFPETLSSAEDVLRPITGLIIVVAFFFVLALFPVLLFRARANAKWTMMRLFVTHFTDVYYTYLERHYFKAFIILVPAIIVTEILFWILP